jgi:RND family efflux transporter MFP subunit
VLSAPMQSGDLQIVKLAKNGSSVKAGDVVVQFDGSVLERTIQEKQSELKQSDAEIAQAESQQKITEEQDQTAVMKAKYDVERAKLDVNRGDTVSRIENEQAKLALADAQQRLKELEEKLRSDRTSAEADLSSKLHKREKALFDLRRAEEGLQRLQLKAPTDGTASVLPNFRSPEFRQGDRAWPGAAIVELPDLSSVHLLARLDETDRSRLKVGQDALVRIEALPGRDFTARINSISILARVDYTSSWPPPKNFDLNVILLEVDPRIRPGMTAVARIAIERVPNVVLVPSEAVFQRDGSPVVYKLTGSVFDERPVKISKRAKEQTIVASGIGPGDRIAARRPAPETIKR